MMTKFLETIDGISVFLAVLVVSLVFLPVWMYITINMAITIRCVWTNGFPSARFLLWVMIAIGIPTYIAVIFENVQTGTKWYESL